MNSLTEKFSVKTFLKWMAICFIIGVLSGSASSFFLVSLHWITNFRETNSWLITFLPLGGLLIGFLYHYYGKNVVKGNNLLLEEYNSPQKKIPFLMA
ncbi:MAG: chloride channel protein, partial [Bacteroidia bacterium]|nr:chloride channel protein [Bacteroidia bacterium]